MKTETIVMCVVALLLGMLLANMLKNVCGCKVVEGSELVRAIEQGTLPTQSTQNQMTDTESDIVFEDIGAIGEIADKVILFNPTQVMG